MIAPKRPRRAPQRRADSMTRAKLRELDAVLNGVRFDESGPPETRPAFIIGMARSKVRFLLADLGDDINPWVDPDEPLTDAELDELRGPDGALPIRNRDRAELERVRGLRRRGAAS